MPKLGDRVVVRRMTFLINSPLTRFIQSKGKAYGTIVFCYENRNFIVLIDDFKEYVQWGLLIGSIPKLYEKGLFVDGKANLSMDEFRVVSE